MSAESVIEKHFGKMKELIRMVVRGYSNALILVSEGGLGKSYTVLQTLKEEGLKENEDFVYITTFSTPLELYNMLYANRDKIVILDDLEGILTERKSISILKSALWSANGRRYVSYYLKTNKLDAPKKFEFSGRVIFCINDIRNNKIIQSLISRCLFYKLEFSYSQKIEIMRAIAEKEKIPIEVIDFIEVISSPATQNLNFRTLRHVWDAYRYDLNNGKNGSWKEVAKSLLDADNNLALIYELSKSEKPVKEQVNEFINMTGRSRATYFRYKQLVAKSH
jgi:hypothetical protein